MNLNEVGLSASMLLRRGFSKVAVNGFQHFPAIKTFQKNRVALKPLRIIFFQL